MCQNALKRPVYAGFRNYSEIIPALDTVGKGFEEKTLFLPQLLMSAEAAPWCKIVVGGAVMTQEYADKIGANKYAKDAMEAVRYAEKTERKINAI